MTSYVTNVVKKKVKQLHNGYVKLKMDKKGRKKENCDISGLYKAEPTEELYDTLFIIPEGDILNDDCNNVIKKDTKLSLPIPCSSKNSSNNSQDDLLDSPCSSLDSGISSSPPAYKKLKKLQFSADSDEIHFFEQNTIEKKSNEEEASVGEKHMEAKLCKTKVYEVPAAEKVKIVDQSFRSSLDTKGSSSFTEPAPKIPFGHLKLKQSIVSPKTYQRKSNRTNTTSASKTFLGNFAEGSCQDKTSKKLLDVNREILNKPETPCKSDYFRKNFNCTYDNDSLTPLLTSPPEKPPRSAKDLKKISQVSSCDNASEEKSNANDTEWTLLSCDLGDSKSDENGYSVPFDTKNLQPEKSSTPNKELYSKTTEPVYAEISPRSSRNVEKIVSSTPTEATKTRSYHVDAQVTPQHAKSISCADIQSLNSIEKTNSEKTQNSENILTSFQVSPITAVQTTNENDILSKEFKNKLNIIHKTNWSLIKEDIAKEHKCYNKNKSQEEVCLEEKFVVNMFQSRPSKRWEKHVRDRDGHRSNQDENFDRNVLNRQSLDLKKNNNKCFDANVRIIKNNCSEVDKKIEKLERESKNLEMVSKKIKIELERMEQESNEAYSRKLEKEKLRIDKQMNQLNNNVDETSIKLTNETRRIATELEQIKSKSTEDYNKYKSLKKSRDIECSRMTQASRALEEIKNRRGKKDWLEILVAERTLLETSEKVRVLTQQIRDNTYTTIPEPPLHKGIIHLSDIKFPFAKEFRGNTKREKHHTDFFVMTLSYETQIFISEFITGESDPLSFSRKHIFKNVKPDFEIKIKLFHVRLRTSDEYFWEKFNCYNLCPTSQIIYEDLLTHQFQEKTVYITSFKLCAETTLTRTNINEVSARLDTKPDVFCKLDNQIEFSLKCEDIEIVARLSGFLDVGTLCGETYFWEKKWCVLDGPNLMLFNYPQEVDLGKPFEQINLEYCFGPIITKVDNCPKRRSFHLKTGRPNELTNTNSEQSKPHTLKTKPNFTLRKFYFAAGNMEEYLSWTVEVEKILNSLGDFKKLAFGEEYAEYLRH